MLMSFEKGDREKRRKDREKLRQEKKRKKKKEKRNKDKNKNKSSSNDAKSLPRFGEWDESDPSSADGYSAIFDIVRKEKNNSNILYAGNLSVKIADQIKTRRRRSRLSRFIKSLKRWWSCL